MENDNIFGKPLKYNQKKEFKTNLICIILFLIAIMVMLIIPMYNLISK